MTQLRATLSMAYVAAECNNWVACREYLRSALGLANRLHDSRRKGLILRAISFVNRKVQR